MRGEKILHGDDQAISRDGFKRVIERYGSDDGQELIGSASSVEEIEELLKQGLRPTVAVLDNKFPHDGDGERAAGLVRKYSPETIVVSLCTDDVGWADYHISKEWSPSEVTRFLLNLKH